jgi:predicted dehydrogenase
MNQSLASSNPSARKMDRRSFMGRTAALAAFSLVPRHVLGGAGYVAPSEKVNVAIIGTGGQGIVNMKQLFEEPDVRIAALCDVNDSSDYSMFYYGGTAGLKPAQQLVKEKYGQACPIYRDHKEMLKDQDIDAVLLATPDHSHGIIALDVLDKKKHLYCEKPLCRTVHETRVVTQAARRAGVATQMGNFGHSGDDVRLACEWIWDGVLGEVTEVHSWTTTGARRWTPFTDRPQETPPVPAGFDWQRWLAPVPARPYHPAYAPVRWRAWWEFGSGTIGDFACHHLDPAFWALKLDECDSFSVEASSYGLTAESCPAASLIHFHMPARAGMGPVRISWYEGGVMPPRPADLEPWRELGEHGVLFIGTKGSLLGDGWGRTPRLVPLSRTREFKNPKRVLPRVKGHHRNWLDACKGQGEASTHFDYAGLLTEWVLMGNVALRAGKKLDFDWKNMKITNVPEANRYLKPELGQGWTI